MKKDNLTIERYSTIHPEHQALLFKGISDFAFEKKGLLPIQPFSIFIKDQKQVALGGVSGSTFYGCVDIEFLWIDKAIRHQGWGTKLIEEAEKLGIERGARFVTLSTMDWEGLGFYQKLGYFVEFTREGYDKDSKMYVLKKAL